MLIRFLSIITIFFLFSVDCSHDKYPVPSIPSEEDRYANINNEVYNMILPVLDDDAGYSFRNPTDIYYGVDNFVYVCNTGSDEIVMMDAGGTIQGVCTGIPHPAAITQNDSLQLLVVNKTNKIYKLDLYRYNHNISATPVEIIFERASEPTLQYTGITVYNGFEYYVTAIQPRDTNSNYKEFSFIYDFYANHTLKGQLPLEVNGTALFSTILPTSIVSLRERYLDVSSRENTTEFMFTHTGRTSLLENSYKFQHITTRTFEGQPILTPNTALIGSDIYATDKFWNLQDVAIDRNGFVFLVDAGKGDADSSGTEGLPGFYRFVASSGLQLQSVLGYGSRLKQFRNPGGIAVTPFKEGQIVYVADSGNNRIMMFELSTE
ncbi:MAG: hypothetical protein JXL67_13155 [Calditrichaeota bacterium]|nr:hypothetical protein [Calditrichota bacterium]